jgi:hypothetical protein
MSNLYKRIARILVEAKLSGASKAYLKHARTTRGLLKKSWKEVRDDKIKHGPLNLNDDPVIKSRIANFQPTIDKIKKSKNKEKSVRDLIPRKARRENVAVKKGLEAKTELIKRFTAKKGKKEMLGFRKSLADDIRWRRKSKRVPYYKVRDRDNE